MKLGVLLPTFNERAETAFEMADAAQAAGLDGVFAYDHLWPMGSPERPSLAPFPILAAIAARTSSLVLGPLVARVGLVATEVLVEEFTTLERLAPGRVIAALGTGDKLSEAEMVAYDRGGLSADDRRRLLEAAILALREHLPVWCGAGSRATNELARRLGVVINLWDADAATLRDVAATGPVCWAGPLRTGASATLDAIAAAGATWAVVGPPFRLDELGEWRGAH